MKVRNLLKISIVFLIFVILPTLAVDYGEACSHLDWGCAGDFQECVSEGSDNVCRCIGERIDTWYNRKTARCELMVAPCSNATGNQQCSLSSFCDENVCSCLSHLEPSSDRLECLSNYGEFCNGEINCSNDKYLLCESEYCSCFMNSAPNKGICLSLAGTECKLGGQPCVANAKCQIASTRSLYHFCTCNDYFLPDLERQCKLGYGSNCNSTNDLCDPSRFQKCDVSTLKCGCNDQILSWYNPEVSQCQILVGEPCMARSGSQQCTKSSVCQANECSCPEGTFPSTDRRACTKSAGIGSPCSLNNDCDQDLFLVCLAGTCECNYDSWYNPRTKICELIAGETCSNAEGSQNCTEFSLCEKTGDGSSICFCIEGFVKSHNGRCVASYGAPCEESGYESSQCNAEEFLVCNSGKCTCNSDSRFNLHTATCELLAGRNCASGNQNCTEYSSCQLSGNGVKICQCDPDYVASSDGRCYVSYGGICKGHDEECLQEEFLVCENKKCLCNFDSWFNPKSLRCELFAGEFCTPGSGQQTCTEFSVCGREGSGGYTCTCVEGFHQSSESRCVHESCNYGNIESFLGRRKTF